MNKNSGQPAGRGLQTLALEAALLPALSPSPIPRSSPAPRAGPQLQPRRSGRRSGGADSQADSAAGVHPAHASVRQRGAGRAARPVEVGAWRRPRRSRSGAGRGAGAALQDPDLCGAGQPAWPGAVGALEPGPGRTTTPPAQLRRVTPRAHGSATRRETPAAQARRSQPRVRRGSGGGPAHRATRPRRGLLPRGPAPAGLLQAAFPPGLLGAS